MKLPAAWDLAELGGELSIDSAAKGSSLDYHLRGHDCSVDLKLGGLGDFVPSGTMVPSSSTAKRARASSNGGNVVSCLVDGCISDLSKCREYHRRHKVCEEHSKTPVVVVGGREQRFCQQCSRFHLLVEFDEVKRSCRKRLEGHNRRRRKPQHDFMSTRSLIANHSGVGFSVYPQIFPTDASVTNWSRMIKSEEDMLYSNSLPLHLFDRQHSLTISPCSYKEGKHFTFLQDGDAAIRRRTMVGTHPLQLQPKTIGSSESSDCKLFPNEITRVFSSDCAPSLLSSSSQTSGINLRQVVSGDRISMSQPLVSGLQYSGLSRYPCPQASDTVSPFLCSEIKDGQMGTTYVPDASDTDLHCGCVFQIGVEGSSDGTAPGLPFPWQQ